MRTLPLPLLLIALPLLVFSLNSEAGAADKKAASDTRSQILVTSKFIETDDKAPIKVGDTTLDFSEHTILTAPQFQVLVRALNQEKGTDLLSAPSVVTRESQHARIEVIREVQYPAGLDDGKIEFDHINSGVTLDIDAEIKNEDHIHMVGSAIVRLPDGADLAAATRSGAEPGKSSTISFTTSETYFDVETRSGETVVLVCNKHKDDPGQLFITLTATVIEAAGN